MGTLQCTTATQLIKKEKQKISDRVAHHLGAFPTVKRLFTAC
jgi:hypothetical protein